MYQAEQDEANRRRALQAIARDACIINRQWLALLQQAAEILAAIDNAIDYAAAVAENQGQNGQLNANGPLADNDENALGEMQDSEAMYNQLQQKLVEIQHQLVELWNDQVDTGGVNEWQFQDFENWVTELNMHCQNDLPGLLLPAAPHSLLKVFTADDPSEVWQDWFDSFVLVARAL